ncbi:peptidase S8/S53 domain-containing protein [Desarmillaria tabescens]|uniref:tripeptidyl-peptidase II n=1 Tax=Armillaria tabescens TaxID=1929756 RepID=A0AA39KB13_ARMTA|nr:peptidase S8/S53 domain-containing protein [Desarmillaria tabescens]KAK0457859.1 peptidase S8/S53 domain-containing protein [Desarmillaria tabescens]
MFWSSAVVLGLTQLCLSTPLVSKRWDTNDLLEKHSWAEVPRGWEWVSKPDPGSVIELRIGLKKDRVDELISSLYEVSTPNHNRYGKHLSKEEVDALVAPHPDSVEAVGSWLLYHGVNPADVTFRSSSGSWITIPVSVSKAEQMLGTEYGLYHHPQSSSYVVRTLSYSLPRELHQAIDVVSPTTYFGTLRSMRVTSFVEADISDEVADISATVPSSCASRITIACLQALYNTSGYVPSATDSNVLGVAGYLDEYANRNDLQTFLKTYRTDAVGTTFETVTVNNGGDDQSDPGANLDIQYTVGLSYPTPNIYYSTGGSPPFNPDSQTTTDTNEPYLDWLNYILAEETVPQTFTTSYGDDEQTVPYDYAVSVCNLFAELGARGSTVFFSSSDSGVGGGDCLTNDGTKQVLFQPAFPASCPYVTAVGGTTGVSPEVGVSFSGGGFSRYFGIPSYQADVVAEYVSDLGSRYSGLYNTSGRAYPDLAAQGTRFSVILSGSTISVGGTSASSPTVAGIFALLNDYRLSNNQSSLGFVNPLIYANSGGFNDITSGSNPGCNTTGFTAVAGWDPVTGLGTPDFGKLQAIVGA